MRKIHLSLGEQMAFDMYFSGLVAMNHAHPGAGRSNGVAVAEIRSLDELADLALQMIEIRREVGKQ